MKLVEGEIPISSVTHKTITKIQKEHGKSPHFKWAAADKGAIVNNIHARIKNIIAEEAKLDSRFVNMELKLDSRSKLIQHKIHVVIYNIRFLEAGLKKIPPGSVKRIKYETALRMRRKQAKALTEDYHKQLVEHLILDKKRATQLKKSIEIIEELESKE